MCIRDSLKGAFLCCKEAARRMVRQRWGRIVNLSSVVALSLIHISLSSRFRQKTAQKNAASFGIDTAFLKVIRLFQALK